LNKEKQRSLTAVKNARKRKASIDEMKDQNKEIP
jgi:hypothetical protein